MWSDKYGPKICINLHYQISHATQIHILCTGWIHMWPKYACQKDMFTWVYGNSSCGFLPLTSATVILPKKRNIVHRYFRMQCRDSSPWYTTLWVIHLKTSLPLTSDIFCSSWYLWNVKPYFLCSSLFVLQHIVEECQNNYVVILSWWNDMLLEYFGHSQSVIK